MGAAENLNRVNDKIKLGKASTEEALAIFDSLEPVPAEFMIGNWVGEGFLTDHPLDGILEAYHWHGKQFLDSENVHPLVFRKRDGKLAYVNPGYMGPSLGRIERTRLPKTAAIGNLFQWLIPLLSTRKSRARLRETVFRGKVSATMVYDQLPINDVFRKIDDNAVFGLMDLKTVKQPFFFILRREKA